MRKELYLLRAASLIAGATLAVLPPATSAAPFAVTANGQSVSVAQGKSRLIQVDRPFTRVLVGNPDIADVLPMNSGTLYVLGKKTGTTNLTIYNSRRELVSVLDLMVGPDAAALGEQLRSLMPNESIAVRLAGDSLVIDGIMSNAVVAERAARIAETFAPGKVVNFLSLGSPQQVLLEVRFSEMQRGTVKELGFRSLTANNSGRTANQTGGPIRNDAGKIVPEANSFATFFGSFGLGSINVNLALDALEEKGLVTTLAQPNLIALSGETASFLAGGEFPVPVSSSSTDGGLPTISVQFKEFGVSLAFTPTVLADGVISLIVAPEVSSIDPAASIRLNDIAIPGLKTRRARTTLELRDGQSFAMAGLVSADFTNSVRQVPYLGSIPILGALFRSSRFNRAETELVITVTPHIVRPVAPESIMLPTERVKPPTEGEQFLLGARQKVQP